MARIFPRDLLSTTQSAAEKQMFTLLREQLSVDFVVFHSVAWLSRTQDGRAYDGEADFVIGHPEWGVIVLEVKGGRIQYDGMSGQWGSIDRYDKQHVIKDPVLQAKNASYNLYRKLRETPFTNSFRYTVRHAICFPDVVTDHGLRVDLPADIIIDRSHLQKLNARIEHIFEYWDNEQSRSSPGHHGIDALIELLAPKLELRSYLGREFEVEASQIKQLTQEQFDALDLLERQRRAIIYGCAGSGKTMLALEKAQRLARDGFAVLFTCFNARLAESLSSLPEIPEAIQIVHFHKLCFEKAKRARVEIPSLNSTAVQGDKEFFYGAVLPQALLDASTTLGPQYDALIVDEGQDFQPEWWIALESLLVNPEQNIFYIFCDDNQNLYADSDLQYPFHNPAVTLRKNCRNTKRIHEVVARYYKGTLPITANGPEGRLPEFFATADSSDLTVLRKQLHELISEEQVGTGDLVILTPRAQTNSTLSAGTRLGNITLTWDTKPQPGEVMCSTIHSFKGLECPVVILTELQSLHSSKRKELIYVAASRARNHLIVIGDEI